MGPHRQRPSSLTLYSIGLAGAERFALSGAIARRPVPGIGGCQKHDPGEPDEPDASANAVDCALSFALIEMENTDYGNA